MLILEVIIFRLQVIAFFSNYKGLLFPDKAKIAKIYVTDSRTTDAHFKHIWVKEIQFFSKEGPSLLARGHNSEEAKLHWCRFKIFSRITGLIWSKRKTRLNVFVNIKHIIPWNYYYRGNTFVYLPHAMLKSNRVDAKNGKPTNWKSWKRMVLFGLRVSFKRLRTLC